MNTVASLARRFLVCEEGPTTVEYAMMLVLVTVALIGTITAFKDEVASVFTDFGTQF